MKNLTRIIALLGLLAVVALIGAGCGGGGSGGKAFQSAKPDVKAEWDSAMASAKANDYAKATVTLMELRKRTDLTPEQTQAIDKAATTISDQMYEAANKGDENAKKSIDELRKLRAR